MEEIKLDSANYLLILQGHAAVWVTRAPIQSYSAAFKTVNDAALWFTGVQIVKA